jgi:hypothetical protein
MCIDELDDWRKSSMKTPAPPAGGSGPESIAATGESAQPDLEDILRRYEKTQTPGPDLIREAFQAGTTTQAARITELEANNEFLEREIRNFNFQRNRDHRIVQLEQQLAAATSERDALALNQKTDWDKWGAGHMQRLRNAIASIIPKDSHDFGDEALEQWPKRILERAEAAEARCSALTQELKEVNAAHAVTIEQSTEAHLAWKSADARAKRLAEELAELERQMEEAKRYGRTEYGIEQILRADLEEANSKLRVANGKVESFLRDGARENEALAREIVETLRPTDAPGSREYNVVWVGSKLKSIREAAQAELDEQVNAGLEMGLENQRLAGELKKAQEEFKELRQSLESARVRRHN